jgi:hypothetical protein
MITAIVKSAATVNDNVLAQGIMTQMNAALASLLADNMVGLSLAVGDTQRIGGPEITVSVTYDSGAGGVITNPYKIQVIQATSGDALAAAINAFIAGLVGGWVTPIRIAYAPGGTGGMTSPYFACLLYNDDATDGAANWVGEA